MYTELCTHLLPVTNAVTSAFPQFSRCLYGLRRTTITYRAGSTNMVWQKRPSKTVRMKTMVIRIRPSGSVTSTTTLAIMDTRASGYSLTHVTGTQTLVVTV